MKRWNLVLIFAVLLFISLLFYNFEEIERDDNKGVDNATATAPPAPRQVNLEAGQVEQFTYKGHAIIINYSSAYPTQIITIALDGSEKIIQRERTENPRGIYWKEGNLSFSLKPVVWEIRNGRRIPLYEKTWNTTEIYFEVLGKEIL